MMFGNFKAILQALNLFDINFTRRDAGMTFQKIIAIATHPNAGTYMRGVFFGKAIKYTVFREIGLPILAERKGMVLVALKAELQQRLDSVDIAIFNIRSIDSHDSVEHDWGSEGVVVG